jgi:hypothetical protein
MQEAATMSRELLFVDIHRGDLVEFPFRGRTLRGIVLRKSEASTADLEILGEDMREYTAHNCLCHRLGKAIFTTKSTPKR